MLPQNTLLWHVVYFELKGLDNKHIQEKHYDLPFFPPIKAGAEIPV